eukprot:1156378-Pelagomonas_calceolata.AAC.4
MHIAEFLHALLCPTTERKEPPCLRTTDTYPKKANGVVTAMVVAWPAVRLNQLDMHARRNACKHIQMRCSGCPSAQRKWSSRHQVAFPGDVSRHPGTHRPAFEMKFDFGFISVVVVVLWLQAAWGSKKLRSKASGELGPYWQLCPQNC